eukprot:COSAG02_NODE_328_length_24547_cov_4.124141_14_plen_330_part_00
MAPFGGVTAEHIESWNDLGYCVFEQILPLQLLADLRTLTNTARDIARNEYKNSAAGKTLSAKGRLEAQRLQPIHRPDLPYEPIAALYSLESLRNAIAAVHPDSTAQLGKLEPVVVDGVGQVQLGVLIEPAEQAWCTNWHRDWVHHALGARRPEQHSHMGHTQKSAAFDEVFRDTSYFNQINLPLYDDSSLWVVPGSHRRFDSHEEIAHFPVLPAPAPDLQGLIAEEREAACHQYCEEMPGAVQLHLRAGDFAMYRNSLWHVGSYVPYVKRATLHDIIDTASMAQWVSANVPNHFSTSTLDRQNGKRDKPANDTLANAHGFSTARASARL